MVPPRDDRPPSDETDSDGDEAGSAPENDAPDGTTPAEETDPAATAEDPSGSPATDPDPSPDGPPETTADTDDSSLSTTDSDTGVAEAGNASTPGDRSGTGDRPVGQEPAGGSGREAGWKRFVYDVASSVVAVLLVGALLFAVSGVWPPMVAIESPSMDPHMQVGDLVFVMDEERFPGEGARAGTGVVTAKAGSDAGYRQFQGPGDVIVYRPNGNDDDTPIIHRAVMWVEKGENWTDAVNRNHLGSETECEQVRYCPAPHGGFITKGDANPTYDQVGQGAFSSPVKPEWVIGTAELRIPKLGWIRLRSGGDAAAAGPVPSNGPVGANASAGAANASA